MVSSSDVLILHYDIGLSTARNEKILSAILAGGPRELPFWQPQPKPLGKDLGEAYQNRVQTI